MIHEENEKTCEPTLILAVDLVCTETTAIALKSLLKQKICDILHRNLHFQRVETKNKSILS